MAFLEVVSILFVMSCHVSMSVCHFCQVCHTRCVFVLSNESASQQRLLCAPATPAWPVKRGSGSYGAPFQSMEGVVTSLLEFKG